MNFTLKNEQVQKLNETTSYSFPKYTSQLINWANQNAQGTRPNVVGQLSELFPLFLQQSENITIEEWQKWYVEQFPNAFDTATNKIYEQILNLQEAIKLIDKNMINNWVKDLIVNKTFNGLYVQKAILAFIAENNNTTYRLATPEEESKGIDGYVGSVPYSVKSDSYKTMKRLSEVISVKMVYYTKTKTGLKIEVED
jgi:hypothetical protein